MQSSIVLDTENTVNTFERMQMEDSEMVAKITADSCFFLSFLNNSSHFDGRLF